MRRRHSFCTVPGCYEDFWAKGLCQWHYSRHKVGDFAALSGPRPVIRCADCDVALPRSSMRLCAECKPPVGPFVNPLVCVCKVPLADLHVDAGMCHRCYRKPLALMKARPVALAVVA